MKIGAVQLLAYLFPIKVGPVVTESTKQVQNIPMFIVCHLRIIEQRKPTVIEYLGVFVVTVLLYFAVTKVYVKSIDQNTPEAAGLLQDDTNDDDADATFTYQPNHLQNHRTPLSSANHLTPLSSANHLTPLSSAIQDDDSDVELLDDHSPNQITHQRNVVC